MAAHPEGAPFSRSASRRLRIPRRASAPKPDRSGERSRALSPSSIPERARAKLMRKGLIPEPTQSVDALSLLATTDDQPKAHEYGPNGN